jgi:hypothetical protein
MKGRIKLLLGSYKRGVGLKLADESHVYIPCALASECLLVPFPK